MSYFLNILYIGIAFSYGMMGLYVLYKIYKNRKEDIENIILDGIIQDISPNHKISIVTKNYHA